MLNHQLYTRCPVAVSLENLAYRYMVALYFECRETGTYPAPGSWGSQSAYCTALFEYLDGIVAETRMKNAAEQANASKK